MSPLSGVAERGALLQFELLATKENVPEFSSLQELSKKDAEALLDEDDMDWLFAPVAEVADDFPDNEWTVMYDNLMTTLHTAPQTIPMAHAAVHACFVASKIALPESATMHDGLVAMLQLAPHTVSVAHAAVQAYFAGLNTMETTTAADKKHLAILRNIDKLCEGGVQFPYVYEFAKGLVGNVISTYVIAANGNRVYSFDHADKRVMQNFKDYQVMQGRLRDRPRRRPRVPDSAVAMAGLLIYTARKHFGIHGDFLVSGRS
jgi:hypothetical protein